MKGIIYKYTSPSGKCYIGQTVNENKIKEDMSIDIKRIMKMVRITIIRFTEQLGSTDGIHLNMRY